MLLHSLPQTNKYTKSIVVQRKSKAQIIHLNSASKETTQRKEDENSQLK